MNSIFNKKTKDESTTYDTMSSLSHTKWNCKYHIVFTPKYRRKIFYGQKRLEIGKILRDISDWQEVKIIEAEVCPDHRSHQRRWSNTPARWCPSGHPE